MLDFIFGTYLNPQIDRFVSLLFRFIVGSVHRGLQVRKEREGQVQTRSSRAEKEITGDRTSPTGISRKGKLRCFIAFPHLVKSVYTI